MKKYSETKKTITQRWITSVSCDICKKEIQRSEQDKVEIIYNINVGYAYEHGKRIVVDVCPNCFMSEIVPFLKSKGAKIEEEDWEL